MDFDVVIERDETGAYIADVPLLPGCHSFGATKEEALENVREADVGGRDALGGAFAGDACDGGLRVGGLWHGDGKEVDVEGGLPFFLSGAKIEGRGLGGPLF